MIQRSYICVSNAMRNKWTELFVSGSIFTWPSLPLPDLYIHLLDKHTHVYSYVADTASGGKRPSYLVFLHNLLLTVGTFLNMPNFSSSGGAAGGARGGRSVTLIIGGGG